MKKLLFAMILLWGGGGVGLWYYNEAQTAHLAYRITRVARGDLLATINTTGTIEPQDVIDVGAQIAGEIQSFGADPRDPNKPIGFNSPVEPGTVLARIADSLFVARVDQMKANAEHAEAEVQSAQAKLRQTRRELDRSAVLMTKRQIALAEHDAAVANHETAEASLAIAQSNVQLARANLKEAEVNLGYTTIKSPVKGTILDRRVNIGQTVISSLNAPSLFLIAKDLSRLEIWASVNETDIGAIHTGQAVGFTVADKFTRGPFRGTVAEIRPNASMTQSVVNYTVVVEVDNSAGKLRPYLTAQLQFEVEGRHGVLLLPNAALRWKPKPAQVAPSYRDEYARADRSRAAGGPDPARSPGDSGRRDAILWVRAGDFVRPVAAKVGLSDGLKTEVDAGGDLIEGSEVVTGQLAVGEADEPSAPGGGSKSPFLPDLKRNPSRR